MGIYASKYFVLYWPPHPRLLPTPPPHFLLSIASVMNLLKKPKFKFNFFLIKLKIKFVFFLQYYHEPFSIKLKSNNLSSTFKVREWKGPLLLFLGANSCEPKLNICILLSNTKFHNNKN